MVRVRGGLDRGQALLAALRDHRREGRARRHAGELLMGNSGDTAATPDEGTTKTTDITAGPGGVMTDEVGVITGELTLRTELRAGQVALRVQYKDADEWYAVTGGLAPLADPADLAAVHTIAVGLLHRPEG
ncbi:hypothetical protein ACFP2T_04995 [Plantactinospora solaniradicis]|uniref:DUF4429 domain-containing protein n=1 Tax=Plantactinospora solaniradicis TaxID=1723736 RepID=A0ABW1K3J1_9ACTN